ncbi:MAG: tetratricopeptide repeat protein [Acidobacteriaceae bacterium]|nr:tetratricopeptide repeat protein [Acidobacteriaceae bacterium]
MARIVNSPGFLSSPRLCRFLTHIVNRTLERELDSLKEFSLALEVFDRTSDYDPNIDAIVRVEARRLRAKLKAYYEEGPGQSDPVLIGLRPGSYIPVFRWLETQAARENDHLGTTVGTDRVSIAVLPFVNMSPEPAQDYFCDGMTEEIINSLTQAAELNVIARTSAFQFKGASVDIREVGRRLGADLVIEGSVRKAGEQLRITAQAVQTESGHHLWSETFRRELKDIFAIQEEIAQAVAGLLRVHRPEARARVRPSTRHLEAYTRYLRAQFLIHQQSPETLRTALEQLRELIEAFPDYAPAYSGMAAANGLLCLFGVVSGRDVYPEVKANAERGYALDPDSGDTCTVLGGLRGWFEHRWEEADRLYERALKLQPGHAPAHSFRAMALLCQGNIQAAESGLRRSIELDPLSASDCARIAYLHYLKGDYPSAAEHLQKSFDLDRDYPEARFYQGLLHFQQHDYAAAVACLYTARLPLKIGLLAAAHARQGSRSQAEQCMEELRRLAGRQYVTPLAEALAAIGLGDVDLALQRLDEAIDHKTNFVNLLAVEPFFDPLRSNRRFEKLLKRLHLPH